MILEDFVFWAWSRRVQRHVPAVCGQCDPDDPEREEFIQVWREVTQGITGDDWVEEMERLLGR